MEIDIYKQKKYTARTYELDEERKALVKKMASDLMAKDEFALAQQQLMATIRFWRRYPAIIYQIRHKSH